MKKLNFLLKITLVLFATSLISPTFTSCELISGEDDKCKDTERHLINPYITPTAYVYLSNSDPAMGVTVKFNIYKQYCDGTINGTYEKTTTCDSNGRAFFGMTYTYKLENEKDVLYYSYVINDGELIKEVKGTISYDEVEYVFRLNPDWDEVFYNMNRNEFNESGITVNW